MTLRVHFLCFSSSVDMARALKDNATMEKEIMETLNEQTVATPGLVQNLLTNFKEKHLLPKTKESLSFECCDEQIREDFVRRLLQTVCTQIIGKKALEISDAFFETDDGCAQIIKDCASFEKNNSLWLTHCLGKALLTIKKRQPNLTAFFFVLREVYKITLSCSHIYFSIQFYELPESHRQILYSNATLHIIKKNFHLFAASSHPLPRLLYPPHQQSLLTLRPSTVGLCLYL